MWRTCGRAASRFVASAPPGAAGVRFVSGPPPPNRRQQPQRGKQGWEQVWLHGRRVFKAPDGRRFFEEVYYDNERLEQPYYYELDAENNPLSSSVHAGALPFNPDKVSDFKLEAGGLRHKASNFLFERDYDETEDSCYYIDPKGQSCWVPTYTPPPAPKRPAAPAPPQGAPPAAAAPSTGAVHPERTAVRPGAPQLQNPAVVRAREAVKKIAQPEKGPLTPTREQEVTQLREKAFYGVRDPCPLSPAVTVPVGGYVYLIADLSVATARASLHPQVKHDDLHKTIKRCAFQRLQVVRWSRKSRDHGPCALVEIVGDRWDAPPQTRLGIWLPTNVLELPKNYNSASSAKFRCIAPGCDHVAVDSVAWKKHVKRAHSTMVGSCATCGAMTHINYLAEHLAVCTGNVLKLDAITQKAISTSKEQKAGGDAKGTQDEGVAATSTPPEGPKPGDSAESEKKPDVAAKDA